MKFYPFCKGAIIGLLLAGVMAIASDKNVLQFAKTMEQQFDVMIPERPVLYESIRRTPQFPDNYNIFQPSVSPDATAIGWWSRPKPDRDEKIPFYWVKSLREGIQPVWVEGRIPMGSHGISSDGKVIVAVARRYPIRDEPWQLLAIDRRSGTVVHDLTQYVTEVNIGSYLELEDVNVAAAGNMVALGSNEEKIQVLEIPSGKTVYAGSGRFPRISPDGKRLAFVNKGMIWIHSLENGSDVKLLKGKNVKGIGHWSPDGRFLPAGAWTVPLAMEKRQIIVDTTTGKYSVIGKLGEGDYGDYIAWVSTKLLEQ